VTVEPLACFFEVKYNEGKQPGLGKDDITMEKIMLLSFDDGTVHDPKFIKLLNRYQIPCTFNLNSGLEQFVWHNQGRPVARQNLRWAKQLEIYRNHEIASHTLTHPHLTSLSREGILWEVGEDCRRLKEIFGVEELGFGVPFTDCGEREIEIIREIKAVKYIRLSEERADFALPEDPFHIRINALFNQPDVRERIAAFAAWEAPVSVFVLCGHSYEMELDGLWGHMERLLQYIRSFPNIRCMTTMEFVRRYYG